MEGPPNAAIRFPQNQDTQFFLCCRCRNHVLSRENCLFFLSNFEVVICENPVNVWFDTIILRMFANHRPVLNVCCNRCNANLGQMFVMVTSPNPVIQEGRIVFYWKKLLFWNGTELAYADTNMLVLDN